MVVKVHYRSVRDLTVETSAQTHFISFLLSSVVISCLSRSASFLEHPQDTESPKTKKGFKSDLKIIFIAGKSEHENVKIIFKIRKKSPIFRLQMLREHGIERLFRMKILAQLLF